MELPVGRLDARCFFANMALCAPEDVMRSFASTGTGILLLLLAVGGCSSPAAPIKIAGIFGHTYEPLDVSNYRAAVLVFVLQDCPICNSYAPRIQRLDSEFAQRDVVFYLIHVDPTLSEGKARKHATDYGYHFPVLIDRRHNLVGRFHVMAVPTALVLKPDGSVAYQGCIDDRFIALGKSRNAATTDDLHDALTAVLDGKPVQTPRTRVVGCAVPDLQ